MLSRRQYSWGGYVAVYHHHVPLCSTQRNDRAVHVRPPLKLTTLGLARVVTELELQSTHADNASYGQRITACALGFESSRRALASSPGMWVRKQREGVCAPGDFAESKITLLHRLLGAVRMPHLRGNG